MSLGITTVVAITVLAYLVGEVVGNIKAIDDKWTPVCCGIAGLILGLIAYYIKMPDMPAADPITAAAIGVASGFAATGIDQTFKQLTKKKVEDK